jgi:hypothetical protein
MTLSYIEGWHAIAEANRIFGYDAWDRQTMTTKCVWEGLWRNKNACSYIARVRVRVRAGDAEICREGCGSGHGRGTTPGEAHESAIKEAETDAMKRALTTFGNPFGLALYDKEQQNVRGRRQKGPNGADRTNGATTQPITWIVLSAEGEYLSAHEDPIDCCKALRQLLEAASTTERLRSLWQRNLVTLAMLKRNLPTLTTDSDHHYADILTTLYKRRLREMHEEVSRRQGRGHHFGAEKQPETAADTEESRYAPGSVATASAKSASAAIQGSGATAESQMSETDGTSEARDTNSEGSSAKVDDAPTQSENPNAGGRRLAGYAHDQEKPVKTDGTRAQIDKSALPISAPRRVRDKEHLRYVARQPCLVCGRSPGHAHHLRFAQPRALGRKVSDEWVVPLCATHHRALHGVGDEQQWWKERGIDPIGHARILWWTTKFGNVSSVGCAKSSQPNSKFTV